ncbi:MAG: P-loop NTPase family protein [Candidatus Limnocylindria bacterium]
MRRVVVGGSVASGKSTFARDLAARLHAPLIELDAIRHGPGWVETPDALFRERLDPLTAADRWVVDGNYSFARDLTWGRADTLVWLDLSLPVVLWRLVRRTNRRITTRELLWNGNRERFANAYLSTDSLYVWLFRSYWKRRRSWPRVLADPAYRHVTVHRFRTPGDAERWLRSVGGDSAREAR